MLVCAAVLAACGGGASLGSTDGGAGALATAVPAGDWMRFDFDAQRSGVGPVNTGIIAGNLRSLRVRRVQIDGTVDSSAIELHGVRVKGRVRDVIIVTTTYGRTIALDPGTGAKLWEYVPARHPRLRAQRPDNHGHADRRPQPALRLRGLTGRLDSQARTRLRQGDSRTTALAGKGHVRRHPREDRLGAEYERRDAR